MTYATRDRSFAIAEQRRFPIGAEIVGDGTVHVRVWAPAAQRVDIILSNGDTPHALTPEEGGYYSGAVRARAGDRYRFRLDGSETLYPDPASRYQPDGPHGASQLVDPSAYRWNDTHWKGVRLPGQVLYELHTGTFTREGTWSAAAAQLPELARFGITVIELMPVAEFDGRFGWGYDGVNLFAPFHRYGTPDDLRRFVDASHANGLGVILDVVYNHLGPVGNYLRAFAPAYFTDHYDNEWGDAINFDGDDAGPVREFFISNAAYWIDEFHIDGLRLDATQQIFDESDDHIVGQIGDAVRASACGRDTIIVAENEPQDTIIVRPRSEGGYGLDALWNDDFHHSAMVALTGRSEAYYCDTTGEPQELIAAAKYGYLFQGQHYSWQHASRGTPALDLPPSRFVTYLQNHDQVANSARGLRGHQVASPARWRALTALMLLMPGTPMLFQGQEFAASSPFLYFADFDADVMSAVRGGRLEFLRQFPSVRNYVSDGTLDDPGDVRTFERCVLDFSERDTHRPMYLLHEDLLRLRRETPAFRAQRRGAVDGATIGSHALVLRFFSPEPDGDRLLFVNLGADLHRQSIAEPLVAPLPGRTWRVAWSSEEARYGGIGTPDPWPKGAWHVAADTAIVLEPGEAPIDDRPGVRRRTA